MGAEEIVSKYSYSEIYDYGGIRDGVPGTIKSLYQTDAGRFARVSCWITSAERAASP
jgi:hypothetical protein